MGDRFDVVIAGAGPAGAQCARDLAARDYDVLVLETEGESEFPKQSNKSTAGTFPSMMTAFNVPDEVVQHFTDAVVLESPNESFPQEQAGAVLDFAAFKRWLVAEGRDRGATYRFDARVSKPEMEGEEIVGVRYNGDEVVYGDVIVDATGPSAPIARALGVSDLERDHQAIGIEYEYENVAVEHPDMPTVRDAMMLRLDHDLAPGGYSWIFHTGGDTAKVGLCFIQNESYRLHSTADRTIDGYLDYWMETDPRLADATRIEGTQSHRGSAHIQPPGEMSTDNFMAIGDTVPTIDPLWGEGIHKCMKSGRMAAITADACLSPTNPDTSAEAMATYDSLWHERVAPKAEARLLMTRLMYLASNDRYDRLMADMQATPVEDLAAINAGNRRKFYKLLHLSDLPLLARFARIHLF